MCRGDSPLPHAALAVAASLALLPSAAQAQDTITAEAAQLAFNNHCRTCHVAAAGDNRLGPSLHDIIGQTAGSVPGYPFSQAMARSGILWDEKTLDAFIADPQAVIQGNNMKPFSGIASAEERARIIAYLKSVSGGK